MASIRSRITQAAEAARNGSLFYLKGLASRFAQDDALFLASGLAFNVMLCSIPLLLLVSSLFGTFLNAVDIRQADINRLLLKALPTHQNAKFIRDFALQMVNDLVTFRQPMGWVSISILLFTSSSLFSSLRSALHKVYRVTETGGMVAGQLRDILLVIAMGALIIILIGFNWAYAVALQFSTKFLGPLPIIPLFLRTLASVLLAFLMTFLAYRFIPFYGSTTHSSVIASVATVILSGITSRFYAFYLVEFQPYSQLFGVYAFVLATMIWIYLLSISFIIGGIIGELYREHTAAIQADRTA
ncbi:MAG: YihY/virulence factor BrkB family protein, partial [Ignavibacteriales bacterium]|nr:YihY/virulence factor BrkB family protein [Ignavibacteriales bacterium]